MATLERRELLIIFASFLIGSAAGWWSRMHWQSSLAAVGGLLSTELGYVQTMVFFLAAIFLARSCSLVYPS